MYDILPGPKANTRRGQVLGFQNLPGKLPHLLSRHTHYAIERHRACLEGTRDITAERLQEGEVVISV